MKKLLIFTMALFALSILSCEKETEVNKEGEDSPKDMMFTGTLSSLNGAGTKFTQEGEVEFKIINNSDGSVTLWMYKPQFAAAMPARFDMEVPGIESKSGDNVTLSGTDLTPKIGDRPYADYAITDLSGTITDNNKINLEFTCIGHIVTYVGELKVSE